MKVVRGGERERGGGRERGEREREERGGQEGGKEGVRNGMGKEKGKVGREREGKKKWVWKRGTVGRNELSLHAIIKGTLFVLP